MNKQQIIKIVISVLIAALTKLKQRLNTIRDYIARMNFRLALRFPQKFKILGGPMAMLIAIIVIAAFGLSSCNVTRAITTKSEYWQRGDSSAVIQTKTIETYDASQKNLLY